MRFDFNNILEEQIGEKGLSFSKIQSSEKMLENTKKTIYAKYNSDYYPLLIPQDIEKDIKKIIELSEHIKENYDNFVIVGMGGSSLGNELLHYAINGIYYNDGKSRKTPKIFFIENVDPDSVSKLLSFIDIKKTLFNIITKSGTTGETMLNLLLIIEKLKKEGLELKKNLIFTTDPEKGLLRELSKEFSIKTFPIDKRLGGRYSILSHVGLLSAAVEGIKIDSLISGAIKESQTIKNTKPINTASFLLSLIQYLFYKERQININALFTYSDSLHYIGNWYNQLMAESLGKKNSLNNTILNTGITPISLKGTTDQHSMLQLLMEGPYDKLVIFIAPNAYEMEMKISNNLVSDERIDYLKNKEYSTLIKTEYLATKAALKNNSRPNLSIELNKIDEYELGRLIYFFEFEIISLGVILNINPINQPAVEMGKKYTYGIMGRKGFEKEKASFNKLAKGKQKYIIG
jgi:glucose-6-phosphate isomerase